MNAPAVVTRAPAVRILGIDPGSVTTGFGLLEERGGSLQLIDSGAIHADEKQPLAARLLHIFTEMERVLAGSGADEVAVEGLFHAKNARSALLLGHARGVALLAAARHGLAVQEYAPQEVKKALVGTGRAEKHQVQAMVQLLLKLTRPIRPHDAADGVAIAVCHAHSRRLRSLASAVPVNEFVAPRR